MTTKAYLGQIESIDRQIIEKREEAQTWREIAMGARMSSDGTDDSVRVQTSKRYDKMGDAVSRAVDYENESIELIRILTEKRHKIISQIDELDDWKSRNVLKSKFVYRKKPMAIAKELQYSRSNVYKLIDASVLVFEKRFGAEYL